MHLPHQVSFRECDMGRAPCCDKANVNKGPWSSEEDAKLKDYIDKYGTGGNWIALPQKVGLRRCGKSCRLRWLNYLRPNLKHGDFSEEEDRVICSLYASIGSRWSIIAAQLPGRTDNDIKNYWNTKLKKKLFAMVSSSSHQHRNPPPLPFKDSFFNSINTYGLLGAHISYPSSNHDLSNNNTNNLDSFIAQKESFVDPLHYYSMDNNNKNLFMFGGSTDHDTQIISYGAKEIMIKQEEMGFNQSYTIPNDFQEGAHKFILSNNGINNNGGNVNQWSDPPHQERQNGYAFFSPNNQLGYDLEEIKQQLIISSDTNGCDDNKTQQEKVMCYYY